MRAGRLRGRRRLAPLAGPLAGPLTVPLVAALAAVLLALAACSPSRPTAVPASHSLTPRPSGFPVTVMTWAPTGGRPGMAGLPLIAQAYAAQLNAGGGIAGRPLQVLTCTTPVAAGGASACAQQAIAHGVVAVVGSYTPAGGSALADLQAAGIPYLGGMDTAMEELTSPASFPVQGGSAVLESGQGVQLAKAGCAKVASVHLQRPGDVTPARNLDLGLRASGTPPAKDVVVPVRQGTPDFSSAAVNATTSTDCVNVAVGEQNAESFIAAYQPLAGTQRLGATAGTLPGPLLRTYGATGGPLDGAWITSYYPPIGDPKWSAFRTAVQRYVGDKSAVDTSSPYEQTTWVAYLVLTDVLKRVSIMDSPAVISALKDASTVDTGGLTPPLTWHRGSMLPVPGMTRVTNTSVTFLVVRDGQLATDRGGFLDIRNLFLLASPPP